jgi:hypothetical protein
MNESKIAKNLPSAPGPREGNRLSTAHLLLWTATMALAFSLCERPPPASKIGFASFLFTPGTDVEAAMNRERQQIWRLWQNRYYVNLAFAPIYGLALGGLVLAGWRIATARSGFPTQPGHWLLVVIGSATALVAWPVYPEGATLVGLALVGIVGIVGAIVLGMFCVETDLAERRSRDIFHWLGVAALLGVVGHFAALFLATRM